MKLLCGVSLIIRINRYRTDVSLCELLVSHFSVWRDDAAKDPLKKGDLQYENIYTRGRRPGHAKLAGVVCAIKHSQEDRVCPRHRHGR